MAVKIKNMKEGYSIADNTHGDSYAYEHEKFHLLDPNGDPEQLVDLYPMDHNGEIDYGFKVQLARKELRPRFVKLV
jgi:hypothetical protein